MVHRIDSLDDSPLVKSSRKKMLVKSEFYDSGEDSHGHGSPSKRPKFQLTHQVEGVAISEYNPLEEPSPLGLKLKKSPSLLDLIQMKLSQEKSPSLAKTLARKEKNAVDKLKASNFPATLLKIGTWEYTSRYEGDLVAKCYFAKHKLVWEVLDGGLKNKIEIQWSDIMAIKANYLENEPETLNVVLGRQPLFFREINPQPRKHTLWQATTDFTSGQATIHRQHFLQFPPGTLQKHFEKLMQCDPRLRFLSLQPEIVLDTPYFQPMVSIYGDQNDIDRGYDLKTESRFSFSGFRDSVSGSGLSSSETENQGSSTRQKPQEQNPSIPELFVMEGDVSSKISETRGLSLLNQIKLPGLHPSMSVGDLVNHISDCISEQMRSDNPHLSINEAEKMNILEDISQYLLSDSQTTPVSDEKSIMSRVNSLCCLLQKEPTGAENLALHAGNVPYLAVGNTHEKLSSAKGFNESRVAGKLSSIGEGEMYLSHGSRDRPRMSRKDSVDELLLNLPRIASLPRFLINVSEE